MEKINVYIDGPNLLGAINETLGKHARVDPYLLSQKLINPASQEIKNIFYLETPYLGHLFHLETFKRQQSFFGYLHKYIHNKQIIHIKGNYRVDTIRVPSFILSGLAQNVRKVVESISWKKPAEKGGDVGLAVRIVRDTFQNNFDHAFVITEDQDFAPAINCTLSAGKKVSICYTKNSHRNAQALTNQCKGAGFIQLTRADLTSCLI